MVVLKSLKLAHRRFAALHDVLRFPLNLSLMIQVCGYSFLKTGNAWTAGQNIPMLLSCEPRCDLSSFSASGAFISTLRGAHTMLHQTFRYANIING